MEKDLNKINSVTKYPRIETYHKIGERGRLMDEVQVDFSDQKVILTEKVDGVNGRIIIYYWVARGVVIRQGRPHR
jgi:ATP-dependent RNA circularization protein (DNA/RNA ligase family)